MKNFTNLSSQELKTVWNTNFKLRDIVRDDAENYAMSNIQEYIDTASMWSVLRNAEYSIYCGMQCGGIKDYRGFADACLKLQKTFEFFGTRYSEKFWKKSRFL